MTPSAPQSQDASIGSPSGDPAMSLTFALQALAHDAGYKIDHDDLNAALGLSWMTTAVEGEGDLARWPMYARDAFLAETGRLFGMVIRDIHPPEAARGLSGLAEFQQHFDASYRPLILEALEHNQPVLAWQGWPGDRSMLWGIIKRSCDGGVGFAGVVGRPEAVSAPGDPVPLEGPPVQLYVVETITPAEPDPNELLEFALDHARRVLGNALEGRFGVVTGPAAFDAWIARLEDEEAYVTDGPGLRQGHMLLAASVMAAHNSAIRFLKSRLARGTDQERSLIEAMISSCHSVIAALGEAIDLAAAEESISTSAGRVKVAGKLACARDAATQMWTALQTS